MRRKGGDGETEMERGIENERNDTEINNKKNVQTDRRKHTSSGESYSSVKSH